MEDVDRFVARNRKRRRSGKKVDEIIFGVVHERQPFPSEEREARTKLSIFLIRSGSRGGRVRCLHVHHSHRVCGSLQAGRKKDRQRENVMSFGSHVLSLAKAE